MGAFVIRRGTRRVLVPNFVCNEGVERLLRQVFPSYMSAPSYVMGLSGPNTPGPIARPQTSGGDTDLDRLITWAGVTGSGANEGGCYTDEMRASFGYERRAATFSVATTAGAAVFSCSEKSFANAHSWTPQAASAWDDPDTEHVIEQAPPEWYLRNLPEEPEVKFPWQTPRKLAEDVGTDPLTQHLAYMKEWQASGALDWLCDFRRIGGFPVTCMWIGDEGNEELLAVAVFAGEVALWPGAALYASYVGRLHSVSGACTTAFLYRFARYAVAGLGSRYTSIWARPLLDTAPAMNRSRTYDEYEPHFDAELAAVDLSSWTFVPYSAGPTWPYVKSAALSWVNEGASSVGPVAAIAVYGVVGGEEELMWVTPLDSPVTLAVDDELTVSGGVRFQLDGV